MIKKKVLFICHRIPFPPNKGDRIRSYNILRYLHQRCEIHLAFIVDNENNLKNMDKLGIPKENILIDVKSNYLGKFRGCSALLTSKPISIPYFYSNTLQLLIDRLCEHQAFDAIYCFSSPTAEYIFRSKHYQNKMSNAKWIMDFIDVDSIKWRQYSEIKRFPMDWIYKREAKYLLAYERRISKEFDSLLIISEAEKQLLTKYIPSSNTHVIGNGVDLDYFSPRYSGRLQKKGPTLVFTGVMDYWPNVDGVLWFVNKALPLLLREFPNLLFYIVGSNPSPEILSLKSKRGVVVTGFVEDVREYVVMADVLVVPLRVARGIQNKVLEAMAMGKAIVSSPQAVEGINAEPDRDLLLALNGEDFASSAAKLLLSKSYREEMGKQARICAEKHSWDVNLSNLEQLLDI